MEDAPQDVAPSRREDADAVDLPIGRRRENECDALDLLDLAQERLVEKRRRKSRTFGERSGPSVFRGGIVAGTDRVFEGRASQGTLEKSDDRRRVDDLDRDERIAREKEGRVARRTTPR